MEVLAVTAPELCQMPTERTGGHHRSTQLRAPPGRASVWSCQKPPQKASLCQKGKIKLLMSGSSSCQQPVSQSFGSPETGSGQKCRKRLPEGRRTPSPSRQGWGWGGGAIDPFTSACCPLLCQHSLPSCLLAVSGLSIGATSCSGLVCGALWVTPGMQSEGKGVGMTAACQQQAEALGTALPCSTQQIITLLSPLYNQHPEGHAEK